jgi:hypothetical protein
LIFLNNLQPSALSLNTWFIIVNFSEKALRDRLKATGGKWDPEAKLWFVPYVQIRGTELEERIPEGLIKKKRGK